MNLHADFVGILTVEYNAPEGGSLASESEMEGSQLVSVTQWRCIILTADDDDFNVQPDRYTHSFGI
jgi:hypothetical protein